RVQLRRPNSSLNCTGRASPAGQRFSRSVRLLELQRDPLGDLGRGAAGALDGALGGGLERLDLEQRVAGAVDLDGQVALLAAGDRALRGRDLDGLARGRVARLGR